MYVSTFYSFKGGVGRTMALVNAAAELAQRGRRVLAVDFDLEAPGLDTFEILRPAPDVPGIIDFVSEYLTTGQAPEIERFVSKSAAVDNLWVVPSGNQQRYAASLGQIDWQDLYERHDGYLLFEDVKEQWRNVIQPDYVLIDSRTGHTDTCGICTRQLPDAVTLLFFPNEQNLRGLAKVVRDIRSEAAAEQKRQIETHFVMSNVPDLDDEDDILRRMLARFKADLGIDAEPRIVHRYDSLSLLNQAVFTRDRPKSRLAKEYRGVVDQVVHGNMEDKDGALHYIEQARFSLAPPHDIDQKLSKIEQRHATIGEVLFRLGDLAREERDWERAKSLFDRAVDLGYDQPESLLARAQVLAHMGDRAAASADAKRVFLASGLSFRVIREAIRLATLDGPIHVGELLPAVASLPGRIQILLASELERSDQVEASIAMLRHVLDTGVDATTYEWAAAQLALALVGAGGFREACELLGSDNTTAQTIDIQRAFNYGMATWGHTGTLPQEPFERVVELNEADTDDDPSANYLQCMAVAYWATGRCDAALEFASRAKRQAESTRRPDFSCWRYRTVSTHEFIEDTNSVMALIQGDKSMVPQFLAAAERS